jgi:hypothetical protein
VYTNIANVNCNGTVADEALTIPSVVETFLGEFFSKNYVFVLYYI